MSSLARKERSGLEFTPLEFETRYDHLKFSQYEH